MKRSGSDAFRSSASCKNSGNINGNGGGNECSSSSECSCVQGIHTRKRSKEHNDVRCRLLVSRNGPPRTCCNQSVLQQGGTRNTHGHLVKEGAFHLKRMQSRNFSPDECYYGESREDDGQECSLKQPRCQHWAPECSNCLFTRYLTCSYSNCSCYNRVIDQESEELARGYPNNLCSSRRRHNDCGHFHHHHDHEGPLCQHHPIPAEIDCRGVCSKEIPVSRACMNAELEKNRPPMVLFKGNCPKVNTASAGESLKAQDTSWLTLNLARPPKPVIADFNVDDISLALPCNTSSSIPQPTQAFDLDAVAEDDLKSSIDMCTSATPMSHNSGLRTCESPENHVKVKGTTNGNFFGCESHQVQRDVIILDDSDDECLQNDVKKRDVPSNMREVVNQKGSSLLSLKKGLEEGIDVGLLHVHVAKEYSGLDVENVESTGNRSMTVAEKSDCGIGECKKAADISTQISIAAEQGLTVAIDSCMEAVHPDVKGGSARGFRRRKKCMIDKKSLPLLDLGENDDEANACNANANVTAPVEKAVMPKMVEAKPRMWESGTVCDLCRKGPSLFLGEWYAWCCGLRINSCSCSLDVKMRLTLAMISKKSNRSKKNDGILLSGKVHKMCALWSSEVYEGGDGLQRVFDAVKRGNLLICAACKEYGATLGCRVKNCRRSFHYPCADELASKLFCRMWDGVVHPVACRGHRHVPQTCTNAKEKLPNLRKWRFRGCVSRNYQVSALETTLKQTFNPQSRRTLHSLQPKPMDPLAKGKSVELLNMVIEISTDSEGEDETGVQNTGPQCTGRGSSSSAVVGGLSESNDIASKEYEANNSESGQCWSKDAPVPLYHMGTKLLCEDISCGLEAVLIPCTNDVDSDPAPVVNYIIENRYLGRAKFILDSLLLDNATRAAPTCNGCNLDSIDDPNQEPSVHAALSNCQRESDTRLDWQGQSMLGRLPYDRFGRLQFGAETKDIIECNTRCPCGVDCLNKELQKGIRVPLEVFKTTERGWGVRTMEAICRGKFVVEYIGEVLTHDEASERGIQYDLSNLSCLFSADHPDVSAENLLVIDGFQMSNVSRFINHSCDGNLRVYRVYTETTDLRFCRIGLYASRDIEIGEELSYDYGYATSKDTDQKDFSNDPTAIRCMCGASNCRQWLWTGTSR